MIRGHAVATLPLLFPLLCACTSYAERHAGEAEAARLSKQQEVVSSAKRACESYGFQVGTEQFARCAQAEASSIRSSEALKAANQRSAPDVVLPSRTTTDCVKSLFGVECTTR